MIEQLIGMLLSISLDVIKEFADDLNEVYIDPVEEMIEKQIKKQIESEEKMLGVNKSLL